MSDLYCIYNKNNRYPKIRLKNAHKIKNQWGFYKEFVMDLSERAVIRTMKIKINQQVSEQVLISTN